MFPRYVKPSAEEDASTDDPNIVAYIASLCSEETCFDFTFLVGGEELPAHKAILASRNEWFACFFNSNPEKNQITISNTSPEALWYFLQYIYTGTITIPTDNEVLFQELILAHQYSAKRLKYAIATKINDILNTKNVCFFLNGANNHDLVELLPAYHSFVKFSYHRFLFSDSFNELSQKSLIQLLKRNVLMVPKIEIFRGVARWCTKNNDVDNLVLKCLDVSSLSVYDIVSLLWPPNSAQSMFPRDDIDMRCCRPRAVLSMDESVVAVRYQLELYSVLPTRDTTKYFSHAISKKNNDGIVVRLNEPNCINHIRMRLFDRFDNWYSYYIEASLDEVKWHKIVDYRGYICRSVQNLYFDKIYTQYIKIVGTSAYNSWEQDLRLVLVEAFYKIRCPEIIKGVIRPVKNVATQRKYAIVLEGLYTGNPHARSPDQVGYHDISNPNGIIIQLAQPYLISSVQLLLPKEEHSYYKYRIETSVDKLRWQTAIDRRELACHSWQDLQFEERVAVFIKLRGTYSSHHKVFHCDYFECPSQGKK